MQTGDVIMCAHILSQQNIENIKRLNWENLPFMKNISSTWIWRQRVSKRCQPLRSISFPPVPNVVVLLEYVKTLPEYNLEETLP